MNVYIFHYNTFEEFGVRPMDGDMEGGDAYLVGPDIDRRDHRYAKLKIVFDLMGGKKGGQHGFIITAEEYESITGEKICPTS